MSSIVIAARRRAPTLIQSVTAEQLWRRRFVTSTTRSVGATLVAVDGRLASLTSSLAVANSARRSTLLGSLGARFASNDAAATSTGGVTLQSGTLSFRQTLPWYKKLIGPHRGENAAIATAQRLYKQIRLHICRDEWTKRNSGATCRFSCPVAL